METGTVKWFDRRKGFGFVVPDREGADMFFHIADLVFPEFAPPEGTRVSYRSYTSHRGLRAANVKVIAPDGRCPLCGGRDA